MIDVLSSSSHPISNTHSQVSLSNILAVSKGVKAAVLLINPELHQSCFTKAFLFQNQKA